LILIKTANKTKLGQIMQPISLKNLFLRFKWRVSLTLSMVLAESVIALLLPLLIGFAINDLLEQDYSGLWVLLAAGLAALVLGAARRFYDTRIYSSIYQTIACEVVAHEQANHSPISKVNARADLLTEFVEFMESAMPELLGSIIGLVGVLIIIASLNLHIFIGCLLLLVLLVVLYSLTGSFNFKLNKHYNDRLEKQVDALSSLNPRRISRHFQRLMHWNIKLSDLETLNYSVLWLGVIGLFVYSPVTLIESGQLSYGLVFSALMYVFQYTESLVVFPYHIQQFIRLQEITHRLAQTGNRTKSESVTNCMDEESPADTPNQSL